MNLSLSICVTVVDSIFFSFFSFLSGRCQGTGRALPARESTGKSLRKAESLHGCPGRWLYLYLCSNPVWENGGRGGGGLV